MIDVGENETGDSLDLAIEEALGLDHYQSNGGRASALTNMLEAIVRGSLTPLTEEQIEERARILLRESWAEFSPAEFRHAVAALDESAIEWDAWGYRSREPPRSLDDAWPHLVAAEEWASQVAETEQPASSPRDLRAARELFAAPLLERHEEIALARSVRAGNPVARNEMVEANTRWALQIAKTFLRADRGVLDLDDLFQVACLGLVRAAEKFDPSRGYKFSTYATWWVRQAVQRLIADRGRTIRVPVHIYERMRKASAAEEKLILATGTQPTVEEIARAAQLTVEQVDDLARIPTVLPLDEVNIESLFDPTEPSVEDAVIDSIGAEEVRRRLGSLPDRDRDVVTRRLGLDGDVETLEAIAQDYGVTRERVRQIETAALKRMAEGLWLSDPSVGKTASDRDPVGPR